VFFPAAAAATHLNRAEVRLLEAAANAFFPPGGPIPVSGVDAGIVGWFDDYFGRAQPYHRRLMRLMLAFVELSPLVFGPRPRPFGALFPHERIRALDGMAKSRIYFRRVAFVSLRALMTMAYLADPAVAQHLSMVADADPFNLGPHAPGAEMEPAASPPPPAASGVRLRDAGQPDANDAVVDGDDSRQTG
jgi:hypothetical protein